MATMTYNSAARFEPPRPKSLFGYLATLRGEAPSQVGVRCPVPGEAASGSAGKCVRGLRVVARKLGDGTGTSATATPASTTIAPMLVGDTLASSMGTPTEKSRAVGRSGTSLISR